MPDAHAAPRSRPRRRIVLTPLLLVFALGACRGSAVEPLDVLVVVLDTVRPDRLSAYGHSRPTTPELARLAGEGVLFEDVTAPSNWTWPSHASIFTGTPPWVHGANFGRRSGDVFFTWGTFATAMRDDLPTLAERLGGAGYEARLLSANPVLDPETAGSLLRGFDSVEILSGDAAVVDRARQLLARPRQRPLFLFVNLFAPHAPYVAHDHPWIREGRGRFDRRRAQPALRPYLLHQPAGVTFFAPVRPGGPRRASLILEGSLAMPEKIVPLLRDAYDSELAAVDAALGQLLQTWRRQVPDPSVVAVTSDHGEFLGERGLVDHTILLYSQVLRVPLVIRAPRDLPAGIRVSTPVALEDLYPTVIELALGVDAAGSLTSVTRGDSPGRVIRAEALPRSDVESERLAQRYRSCRWGHEVVIVGSLGGAEYFDVAADPAMENDLAQRRPARTRELAERCRAAFDDAVEAATAPVEVPAERREQLRELGYLSE
jgi:arylsulfatase A-like enzyme